MLMFATQPGYVKVLTFSCAPCEVHYLSCRALHVRIVKHLRGHARLPCCRIDVEECIRTARDFFKEKTPSESGIASYLTKKLGSNMFRQFDLNEPTRAATGQRVVYVFMPRLVEELRGKEVGIAVLRDPSKSRFLYSKGGGEGSLVDLMLQRFTPPTQFPNTTTGAWDCPSYTRKKRKTR